MRDHFSLKHRPWFHLLLAGVFFVQLAAAAERRELIGFTNSWKYDDSGANLGTAWREPTYEDSSWASGPGALGFPLNENLLGHAPVQTLLKRYISGNTGPQVTNFYFRSTFQWTESPQGVALVATNLIDDGAVFYLNGVELGRVGMPAGPISATTFSTRSGDISQYGPDVWRIENPPLLTGINVIAVELHQGGETSSDNVFAMNLWAELPPAGPVRITQQPQDQTTFVGSSVTLSVSVVGTAPYSFQWSKDGVEIPFATNQNYAIATAEYLDTGNYRVRVSNALGEELSRTARLDVVRLPLRLIPFNQPWRFEASATDLGTAWRAIDFNDSAWPVGPGPLGFETGALPEPLRTSFSFSSATPTYYFRTTFEVVDEPVDILLRSTNLIDDGVVYYLNGSEIARLGMPAGTVNFQTLANRTIGDAIFETLILPSSNLVHGVNVLAAEVHQVSLSNSDVVFGFTLLADLIPPTTLSITNEPQDITVPASQTITLAVGVSGAGPRYQWFHDGVPLAGATKPTLTLASVTTADAGDYQVRVTNALSSVLSRLAKVTVLEDNERPNVTLADGGDAPDAIRVYFSESVVATTATNLANFQLRSAAGDPLEIESAAYISSREIHLHTSPRLADINYILAVTNVTDLSPAANSTAAAIPVSVTVPIISWEDAWTFYDPVPNLDPLNPGEGWNGLAFDDLTWGLGVAGFANGQGGQILPVPVNTALAAGGATTYFRHPWNASFSRLGAQLFLRHLLDDGGVFYLNGVEFLRYNLPDGLIGPQTTALAAIGSPSLSAPALATNVTLELTNVLAAELHAYTDQDKIFAAELTARILSWATGPIVFTQNPTDQTVVENGSVQFDVIAVGGKTFQWHASGIPIPGAINPSLKIENVPLAWNAATIHVVIANDSHSATSAVAGLRVVPDTTPPQMLNAVSAGLEILLTFDEALDLLSATSLNSYRVLSSTGQPRGLASVDLVSEREVRLTLVSPAQVGDVVRVNHLADRSAAKNEIQTGIGRTIAFRGLLVPIDALWRFDDQDFVFGAWTQPGYDDSNWSSGRALLGTETALLPEPIRTTVLSPSQGGPLSAYFRHRFTYPGTTATNAFSLETILDDGFVLYLNGKEIFRLGASSVSDPFANRVVQDAIYEGPFNLTITNLISGENTLAAELHQSDFGSTDCVFGLRLSMSDIPSLPIPPEPILNFRRDGLQLTIWWEAEGLTLESAPALNGTWLPIINQTNPFIITPEDGQRFYRLSSP